jgi:hypothetical protein
LDYTLVTGVSANSFSFCIFDNSLKRFLAAGSEVFDGMRNNLQLIEKLQIVTARRKELFMNFGKKILLYESERSTLVPWPLFDEKQADCYHHFNHVPDDDELVCANRLKNPEAYSVFSIPKSIVHVMEQAFGSMEVRHHSGALAEGLLARFKNVPGGAVTVVNVRSSAFDIIIIENQKLQLLNSYSYRTAEDFIYFLLFVFEQMNLNPETDAVLLSGNIDKSSRLYELLYRYIRNVDFIERPDAAEYSYVFDEMPKQYYYHLFQAALCEL